MKWLFRLAFRGHTQQVKHMEEEIAWLRSEMEYHKRRADQSVDQLLLWKAGVNAISPRAPDPVQAEINAMFREPELAAMGLPDGVA